MNRSHPQKLCSTCAYTYRPPNLLTTTVNDEGRVPSLHKIHPASSINLSRLFGFPLSLPPTIRRNSSTSPNYTTEISSPPKLSSTPLHRGVHHTRGAAFTISGAPVASAILPAVAPYIYTHMVTIWRDAERRRKRLLTRTGWKRRRENTRCRFIKSKFLSMSFIGVNQLNPGNLAKAVAQFI